MDTDQDPVGFRDDLDEQNEHAARVRLDLEEEYGLENESRRVDIRRLCEVVRMKRERSMKGRKFAFFLVFTVFYVQPRRSHLSARPSARRLRCSSLVALHCARPFS